MKINLNDREIEISFKFRSELLFEDVMEHSFSGASIKEWVTYLFCTIIANTEDGFVRFDGFLGLLDDNMDVFYEFIEWYTHLQENIITLRTQKNLENSKKKKGTKKK